MRGDPCHKQTCTVLLYTIARKTVIVDRALQQSSIRLKSRFDAPVTDSPRRNIAMTFSKEKLYWFWQPNGKKCWRYVYSFLQNPRTWQTDRQTPHDGIGRACTASRGINPTPRGSVRVPVKVSACFHIFPSGNLRGEYFKGVIAQRL